MSSVNKAIIVGNLGADPELRYTGGGKSVCELRVATSNTWTRDGEKQEATEWHRVVVWEKTAENCAKYLKKGRAVYVEGRIQTRTFEDKDGNTRYITEIVANDVKFLGGGDREEEQPAAGTAEAPADVTAPKETPAKAAGRAFGLRRRDK